MVHPPTTSSPSSSSSWTDQTDRSGEAPDAHLSQLHQLQLLLSPSTSAQPGLTDSDSSPQVKPNPVAVLVKKSDAVVVRTSPQQPQKMASSQGEAGPAEDRPLVQKDERPPVQKEDSTRVEKKPAASRDPRKRPSSEEEDLRPPAKKILTGAAEGPDEVREMEEAGRGAGPRIGKTALELALAASMQIQPSIALELALEIFTSQAGQGEKLSKLALAASLQIQPSMLVTREEVRQAREETREAREELKEAREEVREVRQQLAERTVSEGALREKYEDLVSKLQAKVECPVCFEVPKQAPINVCPNGHVVCRSCKRERCPTCRVRMGLGSSILAITVIESIPHSCEFQVHGCPVLLGLRELAGHQARCDFRSVQCPNFSCTQTVPLCRLAEHCLTRCIHNNTFFDSPLNNNYNYIIPADQVDQFDRRRNSTWRPDGMTYDGRNFFLKITRKGKKGNWYFNVQMAGSEEEGQAYTATIFVFKTSAGIDSKNSHRFIGEVCPIDLSSTEEAAEAGYCQILTDGQMRKVFTAGERGNDKKFGFSVRVEVSKPEPQQEEEVAEVTQEEEEAVRLEAAEDPAPGHEEAQVRSWSPQVDVSSQVQDVVYRLSGDGTVMTPQYRSVLHRLPADNYSANTGGDEAGPSRQRSPDLRSPDLRRQGQEVRNQVAQGQEPRRQGDQGQEARSQGAARAQRRRYSSPSPPRRRGRAGGRHFEASVPEAADEREELVRFRRIVQAAASDSSTEEEAEVAGGAVGPLGSPFHGMMSEDEYEENFVNQ